MLSTLRSHLHALTDAFLIGRALENGEISASQARQLMLHQQPMALAFESRTPGESVAA